MNLHSKLIVASLAVAVAVATSDGAQASPTFSAVAFPTSDNSIGDCLILEPGGQNSAAPIRAQEVCGNSLGESDGFASADVGHVGVASHAARAADGGGGQGAFDAEATYSDDFIFTSTDPSATIASVSLNIAISGSINSSLAGSAGVLADVTIGSSLFRLQINNQNGMDTFCLNQFIVPNVSCDDVLASPGVLVSPTVTVALGTPTTVVFDLFVNTQVGQGGSASVEFPNSLDFVTGMDLFNLPNGVTVNAPGSFVVNNRFLPADAPEPATLALFALGLVSLGWARRRHSAS